MKNKRRQDTQTKYGGSETGSQTFTVTLYPDDFDEDAEIVRILESLRKTRMGSNWIRNACIEYLTGGKKSSPVKVAAQENNLTAPKSGAADKAAKSMGLKFGGR